MNRSVLVRREPTERSVLTFLIVSGNPLLCQSANFLYGRKQVAIKQLLSIRSFESFDKRVLSWLTGLDELKVYRVFFSPISERG